MIYLLQVKKRSGCLAIKRKIVSKELSIFHLQLRDSFGSRNAESKLFRILDLKTVDAVHSKWNQKFNVKYYRRTVIGL